MKRFYPTASGTVVCETDLDITDVGGIMHAFLNNLRIGYANVHICNKHIKIHKLEVYEKYRGKDFGNILMKFILEWCNKHGAFSANVHACSGITESMMKKGKGLTQEKSIHFYVKFGFIKTVDNWLIIRLKCCGDGIFPNVFYKGG